MEVINNPTLEDVLTLAQKLSSIDRLRLIGRVATTLEPELSYITKDRGTQRKSYGYIHNTDRFRSTISIQTVRHW